VNIYATFSGAAYHNTTQRIVEDAPRFGADAVWVFDDHWLEHCRPGYWEKVRYFRERPDRRGVDFFCFKPFVVLDAFRRLNDGDVLLFTDADTFPVADLSPLHDLCKRDGVVLFNARGCVNRVWTKRDCFILMGADEPRYHESWQAVGRFMLFRKGGSFPCEAFLGQWLGFTANPLINTFDPSVIAPDYPELRQSRCEQSVLTNLAVRYGVKLYREACEYGCWHQQEDHPEVPEQYRYGVPHQMFSQVAGATYRPGFRGDVSEGSAWRNIED
jgi:hypothetical protein